MDQVELPDMKRELLTKRIDHLLHLLAVCEVTVAQKDDVVKLVCDPDASDSGTVENNGLVELVSEA